jgi:broad specificity phosphatase PhoE
VERRAQGWNDQPLNERGLEQAALAGAYVRSRFSPSAVWTSDLKRCAQTAESIGLPYRESQLLREIRFGEWEGRLWSDIFSGSPELADRWMKGDPDFSAPGGEQIRDLVARAGRFLDEAGLPSGDGNVAVVSHGGTMRALIVTLLGLPASATAKFYAGNCSVSVVSAVSGVVRLESLNETAHLDGAGLAPVNTTPGTTAHQRPARSAAESQQR